MHTTTGRWKLGLVLSLITVVMWGALPIALKGILDDIDSYTITWFRFSVSVVLVGLILFYKNSVPSFNWIKNSSNVKLFSLVIFGLTSNYVLYLLGLELITPSAAQVLIQVAPLLLLIGGIFVYKEPFSLFQWLGVLLFVIGLILFFNHRIELIFDSSSDYGVGLLLILIAAITWAAYALAQKQLLIDYSSQQIMWVAYVAATLLLFPTVELDSVSSLSDFQWGLLIFCCINTVIAYGCFAESLQHWEASRVGAVLTLTPLVTIVLGFITNHYFPEYIEVENLNGASLLGAGVLVAGSLLTALSKKVRANSQT